jgi:predicted RNA-binding Zn-ribbon protein involved in translation (DUF1610 family)
LDNNGASITEKLKGFRFRLTAKCPNCGYSGLMGWNDFYFSIRKAVWMPVALLLCVAGIIPGLIVFLVVQRTKRYQAQCPNCGKQLLLKTKEAQPVKSAWGGAQFFDANGQKVAGGTVLARAGKWVLVGAAGLIGLLVLIALAGLALQRLGVAPRETNTTPTQQQQGEQTTAPSDSGGSAPSFSRFDKYVAAVRDGVMVSHNTTTIGKAFEATFTHCKWESKETDKGARFVELTGRMRPDAYRETHDRAAARYQACLSDIEDVKRHYFSRFMVWKIETYEDSIGSLSPGAPDRAERVAFQKLIEEQKDDQEGIKRAYLADGQFPYLRAHYPYSDDDLAKYVSAKTNVAEVCGAPPDESAFSTVKFQWTFTADGSGFELTYVDLDPWSKVGYGDVEHVLNYVYK